MKTQISTLYIHFWNTNVKLSFFSREGWYFQRRLWIATGTGKCSRDPTWEIWTQGPEMSQWILHTRSEKQKAPLLAHMALQHTQEFKVTRGFHPRRKSIWNDKDPQNQPSAIHH